MPPPVPAAVAVNVTGLPAHIGPDGDAAMLTVGVNTGVVTTLKAGDGLLPAALLYVGLAEPSAIL